MKLQMLHFADRASVSLRFALVYNACYCQYLAVGRCWEGMEQLHYSVTWGM